VLPKEQPAQAQALDVHLMETLVVVRRLAGSLEVDGPLCDPVDIAGGCQDVVTEQIVREHDPMEDVLFRQACHLGDMADLDSVTRDDGAVRAYSSPGHDGFRLIAHRVDHTPRGLVGHDGAKTSVKRPLNVRRPSANKPNAQI
jgi:hypothetical protein